MCLTCCLICGQNKGLVVVFGFILVLVFGFWFSSLLLHCSSVTRTYSSPNLLNSCAQPNITEKNVKLLIVREQIFYESRRFTVNITIID